MIFIVKKAARLRAASEGDSDSLPVHRSPVPRAALGRPHRRRLGRVTRWPSTLCHTEYKLIYSITSIVFDFMFCEHCMSFAFSDSPFAGVFDSSRRNVRAAASYNGWFRLDVRVGPHRRHVPAQLGPRAHRPLRCRMFALKCEVLWNSTSLYDSLRRVYTF